MTIRLRDSTNQEPDFFVWELPDFTTKLCDQFPIGSKELQALLRVSKHLREIVYYIYTKNMRDILKQYANYDTPLNCIVFNFSTHLISFETTCKIQQSIIKQIKPLGTPCPNKHLGLEDIPRLNQAIEDLNLQKIWGPISQVLDVEGQPEENAPAHEIRLWMNQNQNHLQEITWLNLSDKNLTTIPQEITLLTGLQELFLYNNQITVLPQGIFAGLNQLQWLALNNNQITVLPLGIFAGLHQLQMLFLHNNLITALPQGIFTGSNQLQELALNNNLITALPQDIFTGLNQLQKLDLHSNQITALPQDIFTGLNQLQKLDLHSNQITALPQGIFTGSNQLQELYLHGNQINVLLQGIFDGLNQLQKLDLHNNPIAVLPQGIFDGLNQLQQLYLYNNKKLLFFYPMLMPFYAIANPALNNDLKAFKEFNAYVCRSSFAQFYKFVAHGNSFNDVMERFDHLSPYLQNVIKELSLKYQYSSLSYEQRFHTTLKKAVQWLFETSSNEFKNVVYTHVLQLAQESDAIKREQNPALPPEDFTNPNWGRNHARENILILIDAMSLSSNGLLG